MRLLSAAILFLSIIPAPVLAADEGDSPPIISYYEVKPSLVTNLFTGGKYIRTDIQLMTNDDSFIEELDLHAPAIRHTLLLLLSQQDGTIIKTTAGKEALRKEALAALKSLMKGLSGKESLAALFFTTFFVQ